MTIPAPDYLQPRGGEQARMTYNTAAMRAASWLDRTAGPQRLAVLQGVNALSVQNGRAPLPGAYDPARIGTPQYGAAYTGNSTARSPGAADAQRALARFKGEDDDPGLTGMAYNGLKRFVNIGTTLLNFPLEVVRNMALGTMRGIDRFVQDPSAQALFDVFNVGANLRDAVPDTTVNAFINEVQRNGWSRTLGEEGIGKGFFTSEGTGVWAEKEALAGQFWTLGNGDAATIGRVIASMVPVDKDSTAYSGLSGTIDLLTMALDPLNFVGSGAVKAGAKGVEAARTLAETGDVVAAADAVRAFPGLSERLAAGTADPIRQAVANGDASMRALRDVLERNPELQAEIDFARRQALMKRRTDELQKLSAADKEVRATFRAVTAAGREPYGLVKLSAETADEAVRATTDMIDALEVQIQRLDESIKARKRIESAAAKKGTTPPPARDASVPELQQARGELEATRTELQAEAEVVKRVWRSPWEDEQRVDALKRELASAVDAMPGLQGRAADAAKEFFTAQADIVSTVRKEMGDLPDVQFDKVGNMLKARLGIYDDGANLRQAAQGFVRGDMDLVAKIAARTDSFSELRDMLPGLGARTWRALTAVDNEDDALVLLMDGIVNGDVQKFNNRVTRFLPSLGERSGRAAELALSWEQRITGTVRRSRPSALADLDNLDQMTDLVDNTISDLASLAWRFSADKDDWWQFRADWLDRMAQTSTWAERHSVMNQLHQAMIERLPGWSSLAKPEKDRIRQLLGQLENKRRLRDERAVTERALMGKGQRSALFGRADDMSIPLRSYDRLIRSGSDLSRKVASLDAAAYRKLMRATQDAVRFQKAGKWTVEKAVGLNDIYDSVLRPTYLLMRPGYFVLQLADMSFRSLLTGASTVLTHPLDTVAVASALMTKNHPRLYKAVERLAGSKAVDAAGNPVFGDAMPRVFDGVVDDIGHKETAVHLQQAHFRDFDLRRNVVDQGMRVVRKDEEGFHTAWAENVLLNLRFDDTANLPYQALVAAMGGPKPKWLMDYTAGSGFGGTTREMIMRYFTDPEAGAKKLAEVASADWRVVQGEPGVMAGIFKVPGLLEDYLFNPDDAYSVRNLVLQMTGGGNKELMDVQHQFALFSEEYQRWLDGQGPFKQRKAGLGKVEFQRAVSLPGGKEVVVDFADRAAVHQALGRVMKRMAKGKEPLAVQARDRAMTRSGTLENTRDRWLSFVEATFGLAGLFQKRFADAPYLRDEVLLQSAKRVPLLSKKDAQVARDNSLQSFPKNVRRSPKQREALKILRTAVEVADGTGNYKIADLVEAADRAAMHSLAELAYGIKGRNAGAQRVALLWPFLQASANAYRVYMREAVRNPSRTLLAVRGYQNAQTEDSGWLYDAWPLEADREDPSQPLLWHDSFGTQMVSVPYLGKVRWGIDHVLGVLPGYEPRPDAPGSYDFRTSAWNPVNFGEPMPGVGPGVTFPLSAVRSAFGTYSLPTWLENYAFPFQAGDVAQDQGFVMSNLPGWMKLIFGNQAQADKKWGQAAAGLLANDSTRYMDPETGYLTEEGANRLTLDAASLASGIAASDFVWTSTLRGGGSLPKTVKDRDGNAVLASVIAREFNDVRAQTGSSTSAYSWIVDKYGLNGIAYLIGKRESVPHANDDGYEFAKNNNDVFLKTADVLGYFFPSSGIGYRSKNYDRMLSELDKGKQKTAEEFTADLNRVLWQTRVMRLDQLLAARQINQSQYKAEKAWLRDQYGVATQNEFNTRRRDGIMKQLSDAMQDETLAQTPTGQALSTYLRYRDMVGATVEGAGFSGKKDAYRRQQMQAVGETLASQVPEFAPLWESELKWEFRED